MRTKWKFFTFLPLILLMCGCGKKKESAAFWQTNDKLKVLSTTSMIDDLVKEIGGDRVATLTLIKGELDPHTYEIVKGDEEKFLSADIIFYNGLHLECGYSLRDHLEGNSKAINLGNYIVTNEPHLLLGENNHYDPHIWLDIDLFSRFVSPIEQKLTSLDPSHGEEYHARALSLLQKMKATDKEVKNLMQSVPETKRYLVTCHSAFGYFTRRYLASDNEWKNNSWKERAKAPQGLAPEAQISISDIESVVAYIKQRNILVLFPESNVNMDALKRVQSLSKKCGQRVRVAKESLYGDAMKEGSSYLETMLMNAQIISRELQ